MFFYTSFVEMNANHSDFRYDRFGDKMTQQEIWEILHRMEEKIRIIKLTTLSIRCERIKQEKEESGLY